ncbi:MAG: hypothetical protein ACK4MF_04520 [Hyphomicrobiaceae bacterium]
MSSDVTGYTAAQYLEAGFREESKGERERAHQYYAYVAEAFPDSPEAEAAKGGLMRLGIVTADPTPATTQGSERHAAYSGGAAAAGRPAQGGAGDYGAHSPAAAGPPRGLNGAYPLGGAPNGLASGWQTGPTPGPRTGPPSDQFAPNTHPPRARGAAGGPPQAQGPGGYAALPGQRIALGELARLKLSNAPEGQQAPAPQQTGMQHDTGMHGTDHGDGLRLPEVVARRQRELAEGEVPAPPRRRYRSGRAMAWIFIVFGWLSIAGGIAAIVVGLAMGSAGLGGALGPAAGLGAILSGLMMAMIGQLALAVFDNTEAVRELAWHVRSRGDL